MCKLQDQQVFRTLKGEKTRVKYRKRIARHDYTNVCGSARIHRRKKIYRQRSSNAETGDSSNTLHFYEFRGNF